MPKVSDRIRGRPHARSTCAEGWCCSWKMTGRSPRLPKRCWTSVVLAASADAALAALESGRQVDLVLSDVMMPGGMNGVELAREIRRRNPRLAVMLSTAYFSSPIRSRRCRTS